MTGHRFGGTYHHVLTKDTRNRAALCHITRWGTGAMGIDVANVTGGNASITQGVTHRHSRTFTIFRWRGDMTGIITHAKADKLCQNRRTARFGVGKAFHHQHACTITQHKTITVFVKWTTGFGGCIVAR